MAESIITPQMQEFFARLLEEAGLKNLSPKLRQRMHQDLASRLESWLFLETRKHLDKQQGAQLEELVAKDASQKDVQEFLMANIPDYQNIVAQAMLDFRNAFLRGVKQDEN